MTAYPDRMTVRCSKCGTGRTISRDDCRTAFQTDGTPHNPSSKAHSLAKRMTYRCPDCGAVRMGVSEA